MLPTRRGLPDILGTSVCLRTAQYYPSQWHSQEEAEPVRGGSYPMRRALEGDIGLLGPSLFSFITSWSPCSHHGMAHSHHHAAVCQAPEQQGSAGNPRKLPRPGTGTKLSVL